MMSEKFVPANELKEISYLRRAESGDVFCMHELGSLLEARGAIDSNTGAEYWYRRAVQKGSKLGLKKLTLLLNRTENIDALNSESVTSVEAETGQAAEYELRISAESGDSTDSYRYAMHLKNKGALSGGVHGAEYWFRQASAQGHLGALTELDLVKSANIKARRDNHLYSTNAVSRVNGVLGSGYPDYLKDPNKRGESPTLSDFWIEQNAKLATEEWLTEIVDRTEFLKQYLRKTVGNKHSLEIADDVVLSVELFSNIVTGHLESSRKLVEVKFDLNSLEITKPIESFEERFTFGLALSWFIDLSIVLKSVRTSTDIYSMKPADKWSTNSNLTSIGVRYVPTPRFSSAQEAISRGEGVKKVIHSVAGHIRTLSHGMKPSGEARNRAPKYLRSQMKRNETFVRPHSRGEDEDRKAYELRLSKFSACAHALVDLKV